MAIKLSANYSKKLGLPQFSSHSFSASVEIELTDITQAEEELHRLYELLQHSVDQEIQNPGYVPQAQQNPPQAPQNGRSYQSNGNNGNHRVQQPVNGQRWNCTDGQKTLILRIVEENPAITKQVAEDLSQQLFGIGVIQLNKMQASQLIEDLLVKAEKPPIRSRWQRQPQHRQAA